MTLTEALAEAHRQSWATWSKRHVILLPLNAPDQYMVCTDNEWLDDPALDEAVLITTYDAPSTSEMFRE
jgi:hypothetical protein